MVPFNWSERGFRQSKFLIPWWPTESARETKLEIQFHAQYKISGVRTKTFPDGSAVGADTLGGWLGYAIGGSQPLVELQRWLPMCGGRLVHRCWLCWLCQLPAGCAWPSGQRESAQGSDVIVQFKLESAGSCVVQTDGACLRPPWYARKQTTLAECVGLLLCGDRELAA